MPKKDDHVYVKHILEAIERIENYTRGVDFEEFLENEMMQDAIVHSIQIIGEAANNISPAFKESHPKIPWKDINGMRNKLVHHYFEVHLGNVWDTVPESIPALKEHLRNVPRD